MARITVEDCMTKTDNQYDLVLLAKERTAQLNAGAQVLVPEDNDKKTIISLREIGEGKVLVEDLEKSAVLRLRKEPDANLLQEETEEEENDEFESLYKGQISKSGIAILPSKRARKIPEKIQVSEEDLKELTDSAKPDLDVDPKLEEGAEDSEVSLDEISETESQVTEANSEDTDTSNN